MGASVVATLQIGVDIVEIARVEESLRRFGDRFRGRVYTPGELTETREAGPSLAARFAAKEATIKALGNSAVALHEIEVVTPVGCCPELKLRGRAAPTPAEIGAPGVALRLSPS